MMKLYLKKVLLTMLFFAAYLITCGAIVFVWYLILGNRVPEDIQTIIIMLAAGLVMFVILYRCRCDSKPYRQDYFAQTEYAPVPFCKDFLNTIRSKENISHTLAFLTIILIMVVPIGISLDVTFFVLIAGSIYMTLTNGIAFALINTLIWSLVHRRWINYKKYVNYITEDLS